jgi:peptidoglycan/xylan/chitin deacetylase (PgdA/CDA1 family)
MKDKIINRLKAIRHPIRTLRKMIGTMQPADAAPATIDFTAEKDVLFLEYGRHARLQGFDRLYVALSFDCDTPEDIPAAEQVHAWLTKHGMKATYAIPGAQLLEGAETYRHLLDMGADFINHGARPHAEWRDGRYWSVTFYNEMSSAEVIEDIRKGHAICSNVLGQPPVGFRAPHFGYFQAKEQRQLMYSVLNDLGYLYSSSTLPEFGLKNGPVLCEDNIQEIALSGSYLDPFTILDSWNYIVSPTEPVLKPQYADLFIQTVDKLLELEVPGILNYYVDPAHVFKGEVFYQAMQHLLDRGVPTSYFREILEVARAQ